MMMTTTMIPTRGMVGRATYRSGAMIAGVIYAIHATGVMNSKQITRYGFAIVATLFIAATVTKWINVTIVVKSYVGHVPPC
jgi:hypothetical protein